MHGRTVHNICPSFFGEIAKTQCKTWSTPLQAGNIFKDVPMQLFAKFAEFFFGLYRAHQRDGFHETK